MNRRDCLALLLVSGCAPPPPQDPSPSASASGGGAEPPGSSAIGRPRAKDAPLPVRADFAKAFSEVKPGMDASEIEKLVGPPDDVRTKDDPGGITASRTTEVWRWGTGGHLSFATLGTVHMQADHRVQYVFGGAGTPPTLALAEPALRSMLALIDAVPSYNAPLHPLRLIRAVNALHPLGKDVALAVLSEYLRVSSHFEDEGGREGVFLILRTLFDPPPVERMFPLMMVGAPHPAAPKDRAEVPRFPLVVVDDLPFNVASGYALAGLAESPEMHLDWMRAHASLRERALTPTSTPIDTLRALVGSESTALVQLLGLRDEERVLVMAQAARLLEHVVPGEFNASLPPADAWSVFDAARAVRVAWSASDQDYRLASP